MERRTRPLGSKQLTLALAALWAMRLAAPPAAHGIIQSGGAPGAGATAAGTYAGVGIFSDVTAADPISGSGTLIDSRHVLTAAHLFYNATTHQANPAANYRFNLNGTLYPASAVTLNPNYSNSSEQYDIAVITLAAPATGVTPFAYNSGQIPDERTAVNNPATLVGFGFGGDGANGATAANQSAFPKGTKRSGVNAIDTITSAGNTVVAGHTLAPGLLVSDFDNFNTPAASGPLGGPAINATEADSADGDSGGPILQSFNGNLIITGIITGGTDSLSRYGDIEYGTRVLDYASFVASAVPEPIALAPLLLAGTAVMRRKRR